MLVAYAMYSFDGSTPITRALAFRRAITNDSAPVPDPISSNCPSSGTLAKSISRPAISRLQRPMNRSYDPALANILAIVVEAFLDLRHSVASIFSRDIPYKRYPWRCASGVQFFGTQLKDE